MIQSPLPKSAQRVQEFLLDHGSDRQVQILPESTATAIEAANTLRVQVEAIGKSIVFGSALETVVVVLRGNDRVNLDSLQRFTEIYSIIKMRGDEVKSRTGYVIGGVSPFALPKNVSVIIESAFCELPECYVAAGHPSAVVRITADELIALANARVAKLT
jgi:prolyl-tRNA editing enzyme YbaK/EbsC (Cys-tRNA(Pro) deacylase)